MKTEEQIALEAGMTEEALYAATMQRIKERGIILPSDKEQRIRVIAAAALQIMGERYRERLTREQEQEHTQ